MAKYYSPSGNPEVWDAKPDGYYTEDEWAKLHPPAPYVPTKEEQIAALDAEYTAEKATLIEQYTDAQIHGDSETASAVQADMTALETWYDEEYRKIVEE